MAARPTLIISPNLAIDVVYRLEKFVLGGVSRANFTTISAGGKGIVVARAAQALGHLSQVYGFTSGATGATVKGLAKAEGVDLVSVELKAASPTRVNSAIIAQDGRTSVVNGEGCEPSMLERALMHDLIASEFRRGGKLVCSGSLVPGLPLSTYSDLIREAKILGMVTLLDASGPVLAHGINARPDVVRVNLREAESILATSCRDRDPLHRAAWAINHMLEVGVRWAVVGIGEMGAVVGDVSERHMLHVSSRSTRVPAMRFGLGDSFMAGLLVGLDLGGGELRTAVQWACAVADAGTDAVIPGKICMDHVSRSLLRIEVDRLDR